MVRWYRVFGFIFYSKSDSSSGDEYFKEFEARSIKSFKLDKLRAFFFLFKFQKKNSIKSIPDVINHVSRGGIKLITGRVIYSRM